MSQNYLTGKIYIVRSLGVASYHIRDVSGQPDTRDHRIERVTDGDRRPQLRNAISRLPQTAPNYFVYCATTASRYQLLEAGFADAGALLQTSSINLQGYFTANFTSSERTAIINALSIPATYLPLLIFSAGQEFVGMEERKNKQLNGITVSPNPFYNKTIISYTLKKPERVNRAIYDTTGNLIKVIQHCHQNSGNYKLVWDGKDKNNNNVKPGTYFLVLKIGTKQYQEKLIKL